MSQLIELNNIEQLNKFKSIYHDKIKYYMSIYAIDYLKCTGKSINESEIIKYSEHIKVSYFQSNIYIYDIEEDLINDKENPWTANTLGYHTQDFSDFFIKYDLYGERINGEYNVTRKQRKFVESVINKRAEEQDSGEGMKRAWGFARDYINGDYDSQYSDYNSDEDNDQ